MATLVPEENTPVATLVPEDTGSQDQLSQPAVPQAVTFVEDHNTVVGHPADMSHDQVNDAIQTQIYGRPRHDFKVGAPQPSWLKDMSSFLPEAGKGAVRGIENIGVGVAGLSKWLGEGLNDPASLDKPWIKSLGESVVNASQSAIDWLHTRQTLGFEAPDPEIFRGAYLSNPSFSRLAANVAQGLPILAAASAVTLATGNPIAGAGTLGLISAGEQYDTSRKSDVSPDTAGTAASISGIGNTLLMSLPLGQQFDRYLTGSGKVEAIAKGAAEFTGITAVLTPFNNIVARIGGDKGRQLFDGMAESILSAAVSGGVLGAFTPGRGAEIDRLVQDAHKEGVAAIDIDAARAEIAKQMTENPGAVEKVIEEFKNKVEAVKPEDVVPTEPTAAAPLAPDVAAVPPPEPEATQIIEPKQMEELTKNTISEFRVGQEDAQGLDINKLIVEGKPQRDIYDRAKALAEAANAPHVEAQAMKEQIISDIGKFRIDAGNADIAEEIKNGVPKDFFAKKGEGLPFDEFAQGVAEKFLGPNATAYDVIDFLRNLDTKRQHINSFIDEAKRQVVEEMQGQMFSRVQPGIKQAIKENTGQIRDLGSRVSDIQAFKESLKQQEKAANAAQKMTREDILSAQTGLVGMLEKSGLELNDRAKFIRTVKNIQTQEQLAKALPDIQDRVGRLLEQASVRDLKSKVEGELETAKVKNQSGKPAGKFTADVQDVLDTFRSVAKMTRDEAMQKINDNLANYTNEFPPDDVVMENKILSMAGGIDQMDSGQLQNLLENIKDIKKAGRALKEIKATERRAYIDDAVQKFVADIAGEKGLDKTAAATGLKESSRNEGIANKIFHTGNSLVDAWNSLLNIITAKSKSKAGEDFVSKFGDVMKETLDEKQGRRVHNEKLAEMVKTAYGVDEKGSLEQLRNNGKVESLGTFKNANGTEVEFEMSKDQAIKKWMELKAPDLQETFTSKEGMAWTPEMISAVDKFLTPADKVFAQKQFDFYREYRNRINDVYAPLYGVNLPDSENYSPIRRAGVGNKSFDGFGEFLQEAQYRRSVTTGSLKSRVENVRPLEFTGASAVLQQHVAEMERFINWANKVRDLYTVFGDPNVKQAIYENSNRQTYRLILDQLDDFARGGVHQSKQIAMLDKLRVNFTKGVIGLKPSIAAKQIIQTFGYLEHLSPKEFASGAIDFFRDPKKNTETLMKSEFLRSRGENIDRDIKDAIQSEEYSAFRKNQGFINSLMFNLRLGDKASILVGGWGVYKKALAEGKTQEQALMDFAEVSNRTQQSGDLSEQNKLQRSGSLGKLATMFSSQPIQYLQREMWALRNGFNGRMSPIDAAKMFTLYHFVLPMTFQYVSDFFQFDPKKQARAAMLGSLNEMFIVKDIVESVVDKALDIKDYGAELPLLSIKNDFKKALFSIDWKNISNDDAEKAFEGIVGATSKLSGVPIDTGINMVKGLKKIYDEDYKEGIGGLLGWPKSVLKNETEKNKL